MLSGSMLIGNILVVEYPLGCLLARSSSSFFTPPMKGLQHNAMPLIQPVCFSAKDVAL
jgi:hypothetical protein